MTHKPPPPTCPSEPIDIDVKLKVDGVRLDHFLTAHNPDYSRSVIQKAIADGLITLNGHPTKASARVRHGDQIRVILPEPDHETPVPEDIPLSVLYEDEYLALIDKPFDMVVHPAKGHWSGTLVNALQFHFQELSTANGEYRSGIVHRLDRDTSGVILIAKEERTHRDLSALFETRQVDKQYLAITAGVIDRDSDYIEARITKHPTDRVKMAVTDDEEIGKDARSFYEVIERFRGYTFVRVEPRTGRTHQIRVHLACIGHPVLADKVYGGRDQIRRSDLVPETPPGSDDVLLVRQALHAHRLRFRHPRTNRWLDITAPLPPDMTRTLEVLRAHRS